MTNELTILSWSDYIAPETLHQFEGEFGVRMRVEVVSGAGEMTERVRSGGAGVDVLCPPDYVVRELVSQDALLALDDKRLPNLGNIEPRFRFGRAHDPEGRFSVIKDWGTTGIIYRADMVEEQPASWAEFWRLAERYSGRVTVLDSPGEVIGAALKMRGHPYNAVDEVALAQARKDLLKLKPHLLAFETDYRPLVASGAACLALGWNGDAAALAADGLPVRYVIPSEGSQIWEDDWAIAAATPNPEVAHAFLDFVMRPEVAAQEALYTRYATGNRAALALLPESIRQDPAIYPPDALLRKLEPGMPLDPQGASRREELWKEVRRGREEL